MQLKYSNNAVFSHFHSVIVNNSGLVYFTELCIFIKNSCIFIHSVID